MCRLREESSRNRGVLNSLIFMTWNGFEVLRDYVEERISEFDLIPVERKEAGMNILQLDESSNPVYRVYLPGQNEEIAAFSKEYPDPPNPTEGFIAVMTCVDADEACPIVHGASSRHAIPYKDPKKLDDTSEEKARYAERCAQISREMLYLFSSV